MLSVEDTILRLAIAAALGGLVGLERERLDWAEGLRTHKLVCLGSCLIMIVSSFGFADIASAFKFCLTPLGSLPLVSSFLASSRLVRASDNVTWGYMPMAKTFSLPKKRYFSLQYLEPFG